MRILINRARLTYVAGYGFFCSFSGGREDMHFKISQEVPAERNNVKSLTWYYTLLPVKM